MITRGHIIGKIVDDIASLKNQIELRNKLGQFDLTKFCEDFFREVLNITYNYNLQNLNTSRSNVPGIDLGDAVNKIAFQITSQKTSQKVNDTLNALTPEQLKTYDNIFVLIIGDKQKTYKLNKVLTTKTKFKAVKNIFDLNVLIRDIVLLDIQKLEIIFTLFKREFRQVKIELEPLDENGNFSSSYYNIIELKPSSPPKNALKFMGDGFNPKQQEQFLKEVIELYDRLSRIPRVTREILSIVVDRGNSGDSYYDGGRFNIIPEALERFLNISQKEMLVEINILENADLITIDENDVGSRMAYFLYIKGEMLNNLFYWMRDEKMSIRTLLNTMDFKILDK